MLTNFAAPDLQGGGTFLAGTRAAEAQSSTILGPNLLQQTLLDLLSHTHPGFCARLDDRGMCLIPADPYIHPDRLPLNPKPLPRFERLQRQAFILASCLESVRLPGLTHLLYDFTNAMLLCDE